MTILAWHTLAVAAALALFLFDFQNIIAWWGGRTLDADEESSNDFTILVPVYGHPRYFETRESLAHWKENVLVVLDTGTEAMVEFAHQLELEGWRVFRCQVHMPSPPKLLALALPTVRTRLALRMDADTRTNDDIGRFAAAMLRDGADLCSVKVAVANPRTQVEKMQLLEYRMAMLSRHFRPWLTSGACFFGTTAAQLSIYSKHSMWFPGEDIEVGRVAHALKMRVRHLTMTVETDAPATWYGLFRQRRLWWAGSFRHTIVNLDLNALQLPVWTIYYLVLVWVGVYFKWDALLSYLHPFVLIQSLAWLFGVYVAVTIVANWQVRSWRMLVFPPYALVQAMLMPTVGTAYYFYCYKRLGYAGRYRFGHRRRSLPEIAAAPAPS